MNLLENRHRLPAFIVGLGMVTVATPAWAAPATVMPGFEPTAFAQDEPMTDEQRGQAALARAREHMQAGRWSQAADEYRAALTYLPGNEEAVTGLNTALSRMDQGGTTQDVERDILTQKAATIAEFDGAMANARQLLAGNQFTQAKNTVLAAQVRLNQNRALLTPGEHAERMEAARALVAQIDSAEATYRQAEQARIASDLERQRQEAAEADRRRRQEQIYQNLTRVRELQLARKYDEALQVIDQVLFLEEDNPVALALKDAIQTAALWQDFISGEREREFNISYQFQENRLAVVPPRPNFGPGKKSTTGIMVYPEDWPSLSIRRTTDAGFVDNEPNRRVAAAFEQVLPVVEFQGQTFAQVLDYLRNVTQSNIHPDWKSLDFIGVSPNDRVNLAALRNVTAQTVLTRVLDQLGDDIQRPRYAVRDGMLVISSEDQLRKHVVTLTYDIRDLLFEVPYFDNAPVMDLDAVLNGGAATRAANATRSSAMAKAGLGTGVSGSSEAFGSESSRNGNVFREGGKDPERRTRKEIVDGIISTIQQHIDADSWKDFGGDTGVLHELGGNLVITQTPRNHQQIEGLLSQLREIRSLQINIESRFLTVDMNWFEKIGFDLDLYFNTNKTMFNQARAVDPLFQPGDFFDNRGRLKDPLVFDSFTRTNQFANQVAHGAQFGIPDPTNPSNIIYVTGPVGPPIRNTKGWSPFGITQDSLNLVDLLGGFGADSFAGTVLTGNPAVSMGIQFLDDIQVDLLIEATQADKRSVVLTAPRLSLFNGQRAWVLVGTQQAIVTSLVPVVGDNSGAFFPITNTLTDGVVLDVEAVVSADRRYVTLTVITGLRSIISIDTLEFSGAAGGGGQIGGGQANTFTGSISLPTVEVALINTTTTVPDKGTMLIGGQRLVREVEVETGVPILSKIPFINRFFTNRVTSKDESTLLILIRPEIIIQQENEDLLFPGLADNLGGAY